MKRLFLMAIVTLFTTAAIAGNPLKVVNGDKKFFKSTEGKVFLEVVFDNNATYDEKMPLTEKYNDLDAKAIIAYDGFVEEFTDSKTKMTIVKDEAEADYKMTINVTKIDEFVNVMGWVPGPCVRVWGTLTVTDKTGNTMIVVDIDEIDGGSSPTTDRAFNDTFGELGKSIAKLK